MPQSSALQPQTAQSMPQPGSRMQAMYRFHQETNALQLAKLQQQEQQQQQQQSLAVSHAGGLGPAKTGSATALVGTVPPHLMHKALARKAVQQAQQRTAPGGAPPAHSPSQQGQQHEGRPALQGMAAAG